MENRKKNPIVQKIILMFNFFNFLMLAEMNTVVGLYHTLQRLSILQ
jgi:hypothetical protein